jgi:hypothetical protein
MSNSSKPGPKPKPAPYTPGWTPDDVQKMSEIFRSWVDTSKLDRWIIAGSVAAIVGAAVELLHTIWLAARFILKF